MKKTLIILLLLSLNPMTYTYKLITTGAPKSGTRMLLKCVGDIIGNSKYNAVNGHILLTHRQLNQLNDQCQILAGHPIFNDQNVAHVNQHKAKVFYIIRDPRDQIVSMAFWIYRNIHTRPEYKNKSFDEVLMELITQSSKIYGKSYKHDIVYNLKGITEFYNLWLGWKLDLNTYTTHFEKLVGPKGGGTEHEQLKEIENMFKHLEIEYTDQDIQYIADNLFGSTQTFRGGQIGDWKKHFKKEHINAFKKFGGQLLIDLGYEINLNWQ
ncbi:MAG: sulfotransferase domain-containing protein [Candidatus Dependentiae bacterium]